MVLTSSIGWILIVSGLVTAGGGLAGLLLPKLLLRLGFGEESPSPITVFLARHWGVLIAAVGVLTVYSAYVPAVRGPILLAAAVEKFAIGLLIFFGPQKRTPVMTLIALTDGLFAILYVAYLAGR